MDTNGKAPGDSYHTRANEGTQVEGKAEIKDGDFVAGDKNVCGDEIHGDKIVIPGLGAKIPSQAPQLRAVMEKYEQAAKEHAEKTGRTYTATVSGSGAIAQDGGVAAGGRGIAIGGSVHGGIRIGGRDEEEA